MAEITKEKGFEIAEQARNLAKFLNEYERAHPESVRDQADDEPRSAAPGFAAYAAMQLARGLTDWMEGRWSPTDRELESFVANKAYEVLAMANDCGIPLADSDFLKESWAAALYSTGDPSQARLADTVLESAKSFDALASELRSAPGSPRNVR